MTDDKKAAAENRAAELKDRDKQPAEDRTRDGYVERDEVSDN